MAGDVRTWIAGVFALICVAQAETALAQCSARGCTAAIERLYVNPVDIRVSLVGGMDGANCSLNEGVYFTLRKSHESYDELFATMLTLKSTRRAAFFRIRENSSDCALLYIMWE